MISLNCYEAQNDSIDIEGRMTDQSDFANISKLLNYRQIQQGKG